LYGMMIPNALDSTSPFSSLWYIYFSLTYDNLVARRT
jgi:hypothetical protein